jgi:arginase family enzyme
MGFSPELALKVLDWVAQVRANFLSLDIVELNPQFDQDNKPLPGLAARMH